VKLGDTDPFRAVAYLVVHHTFAFEAGQLA
jgi:hypothetical protein